MLTVPEENVCPAQRRATVVDVEHAIGGHERAAVEVQNSAGGECIAIAGVASLDGECIRAVGGRCAGLQIEGTRGRRPVVVLRYESPCDRYEGAAQGKEPIDADDWSSRRVVGQRLQRHLDVIARRAEGGLRGVEGEVITRGEVGKIFLAAADPAARNLEGAGDAIGALTLIDTGEMEHIGTIGQHGIRAPGDRDGSGSRLGAVRHRGCRYGHSTAARHRSRWRIGCLGAAGGLYRVERPAVRTAADYGPVHPGSAPVVGDCGGEGCCAADLNRGRQRWRKGYVYRQR